VPLACCAVRDFGGGSFEGLAWRRRLEARGLARRTARGGALFTRANPLRCTPCLDLVAPFAVRHRLRTAYLPKMPMTIMSQRRRSTASKSSLQARDISQLGTAPLFSEGFAVGGGGHHRPGQQRPSSPCGSEVTSQPCYSRNKSPIPCTAATPQPTQSNVEGPNRRTIYHGRPLALRGRFPRASSLAHYTALLTPAPL
jgi:hypothetical protein